MKSKTNNQLITGEAIISLKAIGVALRIARKKRGFSLVDLALRTGFDRRTLAQLEAGNPGVSMGVFVQALSLLNLLRGLEECLKPEHDIEMLAADIRKRRKGQAIAKKIPDDEVDF